MSPLVHQRIGLTVSRLIQFMFIASATIMGLAGIDLVLPAIPLLPDQLGGDLVRAQLVLAAYILGVAGGLIFFGEMGARFNQLRLLGIALSIFAVTSLASLVVQNIDQLIALRLLQGFSSAAAAVFAPVWLRRIYDGPAAIKALSVLGAVESLTPALAPILGVYLLAVFGWQAGFMVTAIVAVLLLILMVLLAKRLPGRAEQETRGSYGDLFRRWRYVRHGLSQACTLGALLIFAFGMPAMITKGLGGTIEDFVIIQVVGVSFFILSTSFASRLVGRFGMEAVVMTGSVMSALGLAFMLVYALSGGSNGFVIMAAFVPVNAGLGIRAPSGFYQALAESGGNESRAAAMILLATSVIASLGTAAAAPFVDDGLFGLTLVAFLVSVVSPVALAFRPKSL